MNYLFICVISVFLTITLCHDSQGEILRAPFYFYYEEGAVLNVKVILKNKPADVDFEIYKWCSSIYNEEIHKGSDFFSLHSMLWCQKTRVFIELFSNIKRSYKKTMIILEGRIEDQSNGTMADQIFDHTGVCLNFDSPCTIELDLKGIHPDSYINTTQTTHNAKPMTRERETTKLTDLSNSMFVSDFTTLLISGNNVMVVNGNNAKTPPKYGNNAATTPKYVKNANGNNEATPPQHGNNATTTPRYGKNANGNNATTTPQYRNNERTSEQTINYSISGTETKTYTVAIASAVSGIALVLLAIFAILAIKKRMEKDSSPATPRVQKNKVNNPFYVNLLFQKECAKEIEDIENHIYEEIKTQEVEVN